MPATEVGPFGIEIISRRDDRSELLELLRFAELCKRAGVAQYVKRAFYDSKAGLVTFDLDPAVTEDNQIGKAILNAGRESIMQFDWFGKCEGGFEDLEEETYPEVYEHLKYILKE